MTWYESLSNPIEHALGPFDMLAPAVVALVLLSVSTLLVYFLVFLLPYRHPEAGT